MGQVIERDFKPRAKPVETAELRDPRDMHKHYECPRCKATTFVVLVDKLPLIRCSECYIGIYIKGVA